MTGRVEEFRKIESEWKAALLDDNDRLAEELVLKMHDVWISMTTDELSQIVDLKTGIPK